MAAVFVVVAGVQVLLDMVRCLGAVGGRRLRRHQWDLLGLVLLLLLLLCRILFAPVERGRSPVEAAANHPAAHSAAAETNT